MNECINRWTIAVMSTGMVWCMACMAYLCGWFASVCFAGQLYSHAGSGPEVLALCSGLDYDRQFWRCKHCKRCAPGSDASNAIRSPDLTLEDSVVFEGNGVYL